MMKKTGFILSILALAGSFTTAKAQNAFGSLDDNNTITTAVPFLLIAPDSRSGGMGNAGVATSADGNSAHWNPAKLSFLEKGSQGVSLSYTPWLSRLVPDIDLAYVTYYNKLDDRQAFAITLRYFSLGEINFTDENGGSIGTFNPNEFAIGGTYSLKLFDNFSAGIGLRYIFSNLTAGQSVSGLQTQPGTSFASDISVYYESEQFRLEDMDAKWAAGMNISNIGAKIAYTESGDEDFLPTNLRLGGAFTMIFDKYNELTIAADANKLLVPTPPVRDDDGNIVAGEDPNVGVITGIFQSFGDAPNGGTEELREITYSIGVEYWYDQKFAVRGGYFYEHETKGNRQYFTIGAGLKYNVFGIDMAYLIPAKFDVRSPLENTLRFSLNFDLEAFGDQGGEE